LISSDSFRRRGGFPLPKVCESPARSPPHAQRVSSRSLHGRLRTDREPGSRYSSWISEFLHHQPALRHDPARVRPGLRGLSGLENLAHLVPSSIQVQGRNRCWSMGSTSGLSSLFSGGKHVGPILGLEGGYAKCFLLSAVVAVFMLWLAGWWHRLKRDHPTRVRHAQAAAVIIMILVFVLR
jgi:hypothetical protein